MEQLPRIHPDMPPAGKCHYSLLFGMPFLSFLSRMFVVAYFRFCLVFFELVRCQLLNLSGAPLPGLDDPEMQQLPRIHPDMPPASE
jgi:hypothetical protein